MGSFTPDPLDKDRQGVHGTMLERRTYSTAHMSIWEMRVARK